MSDCKWYQLLCQRAERQNAVLQASTDTIPKTIKDVSQKQLLVVAGVGIVVLALVGFYTR